MNSSLPFENPKNAFPILVKGESFPRHPRYAKGGDNVEIGLHYVPGCMVPQTDPRIAFVVLSIVCPRFDLYGESAAESRFGSREARALSGAQRHVDVTPYPRSIFDCEQRRSNVTLLIPIECYA